jgi:hypothetical protein
MRVEDIVRTAWKQVEVKYKQLCDNIICRCAGLSRPLLGEFRGQLLRVNPEPSLTRALNG